MDHFSYLIDWQHRYLLIGIVFLIMTVVFALSGEAFERFGHIAQRTKEPKRFWWDVVMCLLGGLFFIGLYLYQNSK